MPAAGCPRGTGWLLRRLRRWRAAAAGRIQGEVGHHGCRRAELLTRVAVRKSNRSGRGLVVIQRATEAIAGAHAQPRPVGRRSKQARQGVARPKRVLTVAQRKLIGERMRKSLGGAARGPGSRYALTEPSLAPVPRHMRQRGLDHRSRAPYAPGRRVSQRRATGGRTRFFRTVEGSPVQPPVQESGSGARHDGRRRRTGADAHRAACRRSRRSGPNRP